MLHKQRPPTVKIQVGEARPLTREDLNGLVAKRTEFGSNTQRLRESHHYVARLVALGQKDKAIAERTGYSANRVSQLRKSPAFQQLVSRYREMVDNEFVENVDEYMRLAVGNMIAAERHIADHISEADEANELIPIKTALAISRDAADRFGYGKKTTQVNVNVDFAARLEAARRRSQLKTIEVQPPPPTTPPPAVTSGVPVAPIRAPQPIRRRA